VAKENLRQAMESAMLCAATTPRCRHRSPQTAGSGRGARVVGGRLSIRAAHDPRLSGDNSHLTAMIKSATKDPRSTGGPLLEMLAVLRAIIAKKR